MEGSWIVIACIAGLLAVVAAYYLWYRLPDASEDFAGRSREQSWVLGFLVPAGLLGYGIFIISNESFTFHGRGGSYVVDGSTAVAFGIAILSAAAAVHFHYWWSASKRLWPFSELGKLAAMLCGVVFMGRGFYLFFFR